VAADLHIHVNDGIPDRDIAAFFANCLGSKHFKGFRPQPFNEDLYIRMERTANVWVGEVSWLKAAVFENQAEFIPGTVMEVQRIVGEDMPIINDEFIQMIESTFDIPNTTGYRLAKKEDVTTFLRQYMGKPVFTISW
jgi:hypothetical protein